MKKLLTYSILFTLVMASLSSCLKERVGNIDTGNGNTTNVVEFKNTGNNMSAQSSKYPRYHADLGAISVGGSATITLNVSYSGVNAAPGDITANIVVDESTLALFNEQNGTDYVLPPSDVYSFPSSVVIKGGTRQTAVEMTINVTSNFDFGVNYAVPLRIASTTPEAIISANFGSALYSFGVRNIYDGIYTVTALAPMVDVTSSTLTGLYPLEDMSLITITGNSSALYDNGDYFTEGYYHPIRSGASSVSAYGSFSPQFIFNNDVVTGVVNVYGQNAGALLRSGRIVSDYVNSITFNPDGSVNYFDVKYEMLQGTSVRTTFTERFTRTGDR